MLDAFSANYLPQVERELLDFINSHTLNNRLKKSMIYSLEAGGKRLRPLIVLATLLSFGDEITKGSCQVAASLEMVHTYSLIHDDLPAMDDDDLRRGKPTNHQAFDEATAILAGDGLLTAAFQSLSEAAIDTENKITLIRLLSKAAGTEGMVAGQMGDMEAEDSRVSLEELVAIHRGKTGALLTYAFLAGGILAHQNAAVLAILQRLGEHIGLAFQIRDDVLDEIGSTKELGKHVGQDKKLNKSTYISLLGLEKAKQALNNELYEAKQACQELVKHHFSPQLTDELLDSLRLL